MSPESLSVVLSACGVTARCRPIWQGHGPRDSGQVDFWSIVYLSPKETTYGIVIDRGEEMKHVLLYRVVARSDLLLRLHDNHVRD